jgi:hypothetical protein
MVCASASLAKKKKERKQEKGRKGSRRKRRKRMKERARKKNPRKSINCPARKLSSQEKFSERLVLLNAELSCLTRFQHARGDDRIDKTDMVFKKKDGFFFFRYSCFFFKMVMMKSMGISLSKDLAEVAYSKIDLDGHGVSFEEFVAYMAKFHSVAHKGPLSEEDVELIHKVLDRSGTGEVNGRNFHRVFFLFCEFLSRSQSMTFKSHFALLALKCPWASSMPLCARLTKTTAVPLIWKSSKSFSKNTQMKIDVERLFLCRGLLVALLARAFQMQGKV